MKVSLGWSEQDFAGHVPPPVQLAVHDEGIGIASLRERAVVRDRRTDVVDEFPQACLIALVDVIFVELERERDIAAVEEDDRALGCVEEADGNVVVAATFAFFTAMIDELRDELGNDLGGVGRRRGVHFDIGSDEHSEEGAKGGHRDLLGDGFQRASHLGLSTDGEISGSLDLRREAILPLSSRFVKTKEKRQTGSGSPLGARDGAVRIR